MAIVIDRDQGIQSELEDRVGLECPYCGVFAHMQPQSVPDASSLLRDKPKHVGLVYKCDACNAPVFLRFAVREYRDNTVELYRNFVELESSSTSATKLTSKKIILSRTTAARAACLRGERHTRA